MKSKDYAIEVRGLHKSFAKLHVLRGIDLRVKRGSILALLGPNGAGKTTTVRILATLMRADKGEVLIEGFDVAKDPDKVRALIGLTGQYAAVDEYLTGRENLRMMGRLYHLSKKDTIARTEELLDQFDLLDAADRYAKTYSGGMRRRLDLAASLIATPPVLFLDEPTTGLDPRSRRNMWDMIQTLADEGTTILLTTQHLEEADRLADQIMVIDNGDVIAEGTSDELKKKAGSERVEFIFETTGDLEKAVKIINGKSVRIDTKQKLVSMSNNKGVITLREHLDDFQKANIKVSGMSLSKPTLDDVFLKLTGHAAIHKTDKHSTGHTTNSENIA